MKRVFSVAALAILIGACASPTQTPLPTIQPAGTPTAAPSEQLPANAVASACHAMQLRHRSRPRLLRHSAAKSRS